MENNTVILPSEVENFINAFKSIGAGSLSLSAAKNLQKAIKSTMLDGRKSSVSIRLDIKKTNDEMISIEGETKATLPPQKISGAFFVNTSTYLPSRNRPDQSVITYNN